MYVSCINVCRHVYMYVCMYMYVCISLTCLTFDPCSSGVGRTGVFITLDIILERLAVEGLIDVFQTIKMLRIQRSAMVQTLVSNEW